MSDEVLVRSAGEATVFAEVEPFKRSGSSWP